LNSLAFPAISTGAFRYPASLAAAISLKAVVESLDQTSSVHLVRFVLFDAPILKKYQSALEKLVGTRSEYRIEKAS